MVTLMLCGKYILQTNVRIEDVVKSLNRAQAADAFVSADPRLIAYNLRNNMQIY
jgi:hypothetical protein